MRICRSTDAAIGSESKSAADMVLVDLFSGCGGFSLGAQQAGFQVAAAFDNDPILSLSYPLNFAKTKLVLRDITTLTGDIVRATAGGRVDGIFGGPPCQGFSDIGRHKVDDPRRQLLRHFFRLVHEVTPAFFVMENVRGLAYSGARGVLEDAVKLVDDKYAVLGPHIWDAAQFGAATKRSRLFVIGIHKDYGEPLALEDIVVLKRSPATVEAAITDLASARPVGEKNGFDLWRRVGRAGRPFNYARSLHSPDGLFTGHRATVHTAKVMERFARIPEEKTALAGIRGWRGSANVLHCEPAPAPRRGPIKRSGRFTPAKLG